MRVELVPLPHRPPSATNDTLQVPSNLGESARAEPDRMTPALSASATTDVLSMGCVPLLEDAGLPGFDGVCAPARERPTARSSRTVPPAPAQTVQGCKRRSM